MVLVIPMCVLLSPRLFLRPLKTVSVSHKSLLFQWALLPELWPVQDSFTFLGVYISHSHALNVCGLRPNPYTEALIFSAMVSRGGPFAGDWG